MPDEPERDDVQGPHPGPRRCWVYRSERSGETYLYLAREDGFEAAPRALIEKMGRLELVMELELYPGRKLARANVAEVIQSLERKGFYLQLPPAKMPGRYRLQ